MLNSKIYKTETVSRYLSGLSGKKQLLKKLYAFIVTAMLFSASANAQIVYTDINPDVTKTCTASGNNYTCNSFDSIDINNDGVFDLKLELYLHRLYILMSLYESGYVKATPLHGRAIRTDNSGYPLYMNLNDVISTSGSASMASGQILISKSLQAGQTTTSGNWTTTTDGFLGLKIVSGSQVNYCWVRMNVAVAGNFTSASFTIKDFAYNSISYQAILAGQTTVTGIIENSFASSINLFPNPANNHLTIALGSNNQKVKVTIADITGKIIYSTTASETQKVEVNTKDFAEGIYVVQIQTADFFETKKLVVEK